MASTYDVIIVGGRPAGAALAVRLGEQGRRVLLVDRARFPSLPTVPSAPALHMGTLALLDEIGVPESAYAAGAQRFEDYVIRFGSWFDVHIRMPEVHGRAYGLYIERPAFDLAVWERAGAFPTVERREGFSVEGLLRDDAGRVVGVEGHTAGGETERISARWLVGADGRFSAVARMAGAKVLENHDDKASTVYFAEWDGIAPRAPGLSRELEVYTDARGTDILFFPLPGGRTCVTLHQRADRVDIAGDADAYYRKVVATYPWFAERFADARVVSRLLGLKKIANGYREASGAGWALVGDALHFKDPVDGQGIYDALVTGKILAEELGAALDAGRDAIPAYGPRVDDATRPMFEATLGRLATELYGPPPNAAVATVLRWLLTDPAYKERLFRFLGRDPAVDPRRWRPVGFVLGCLARGLGRDVARMFGRRALPGPETATKGS